MSIPKQLLADYDFSKFGTASPDLWTLTDKRYSAPRQTVRPDHPRVNLTAEMLPAIRAALDNPDCARLAEAFRSLADSECDGILGSPEPDFNGRKGLHNFDPRVLAQIEAKALNYLLTGDENYGCSALLGIFNFIDTLDIQWIASDGCREYSGAMHCAAEVYDWCYDLMTPEIRAALIAAVESRLCAGEVGYPEFTGTPVYKLKIEVGFPPTGQGGVNGHGSESQLMRNYLAFAIAIFNENPTWWELCAGRLQDEYIPFRRDYYKTGMYPQGTSNYIVCRFYADLTSAWLYKCATGEQPYEGFEAVIPSVFAMELPNGTSVFGYGDGPVIPPMTRYGNIAAISAALSRDPLHWACAAAAGAFEPAKPGPTYSTPSLMLIYASGGTEKLADRFEKLPVILCNGYHMGQLISRARWHDENAPASLMKIGVKSTANHEHGDSGSFQIYYKGMLTCDGGLYSNYGHFQTRFYHASSISHNTMLFCDPEKVKPASGLPAEKWYCGGQRIRMGVADWQNNRECETAVQTGMACGYRDAARREAKFAYVAGDMAKAYDGEVDYAGRQMLTVYTGDAACPMVMFVRDDFTLAAPRIKPAFLFHIFSGDEPGISGASVCTENGGGRLTLTSLSDGAVLTGIGGEGHHQEINGMECRSNMDRTDGHWGRVEITLPSCTDDGALLNVFAVTDAGVSAPAAQKIAAERAHGAIIGDTAAVFADSRARETEPITFTLPRAAEVYLCGIAAGEWEIAVNGKVMGTETAAEEGGMITFAAEGQVTVTKK